MNKINYIKNRMLRNKLFQFFPFLFFALFVYLISYKLIGGVLSTGDSPYYWPFSSVNSFSTWNTAYLGFSRVSSMGGLQFFSSITYFFSKLGLSNEVISYFMNYGPVYICSLVYYFIAKRMSADIFLAYFAGLFIILNNIALEYFLVFPELVFYSLIVYGITLLICYEIYLYGLTFKKIILIVLLSFFQFHPFFLVVNLLFLFIFSVYYSITHFKVYSKKQLLSYFTVLFLGILFIQSYWLIPFIKNIFISSSLQVYGVSGVFAGYFQSTTYVNLFSLYNYPGVPGELMHGSILQFLLYFYLLFLVVFLFLKNRSKDRSWIIFLFLNLLIFFGLALGPKSQLTGGAWMYLYNNFSPFGFFRSFTRFINIYLVILIFLIVLLFKNWKSRYRNYVLSFTVLLLLAANTIFFSGNLGGFITSARVPQEYLSVNEQYFQGDQSQYNILTLPNIPYQARIWGSVTEKYKTGAVSTESQYFSECFFSKAVVFNNYAIQLDQHNDLFKSFFKYNKDFTFPENFNQIVNEINAKYILVSKDLIDVMDYDSQVQVQQYLNYLNGDKDLVLKEDNNSFALYENKNYFPIISMPNIKFTKVNDTEYIISINNLINKKSLSFLQNYNGEWQLYLRKISTNEKCEPIKYYDGVQTTECRSVENKIDWETLSYLYQKPIFDDTHKLIYDYANQWTINPEYIKQNFSKDYYKENSDGSIDIELTLYFKPQSYFYLGLIVSGTTLLGCIIYLIVDEIKNRKKKAKNKEDE